MVRTLAINDFARRIGQSLPLLFVNTICWLLDGVNRFLNGSSVSTFLGFPSNSIEMPGDQFEPPSTIASVTTVTKVGYVSSLLAPWRKSGAFSVSFLGKIGLENKMAYQTLDDNVNMAILHQTAREAHAQVIRSTYKELFEKW